MKPCFGVGCVVGPLRGMGGASVYTPSPPKQMGQTASRLHVCASAAEQAKVIQYGGAEGGGAKGGGAKGGGAEGGGASRQEVRQVLKAGHMRHTGQTGAVHVLHSGFCTYTEGGEQNGGKN